MDAESVNMDSDNDDDNSEEENADESLQTKMEKVEITIKSEGDKCDIHLSSSQEKSCDKCESTDPISKESESSTQNMKSEHCEQQKEDSDKSDEECMFPDTSITLQHVQGDK